MTLPPALCSANHPSPWGVAAALQEHTLLTWGLGEEGGRWYTAPWQWGGLSGHRCSSAFCINRGFPLWRQLVRGLWCCGHGWRWDPCCEAIRGEKLHLKSVNTGMRDMLGNGVQLLSFLHPILLCRIFPCLWVPPSFLPHQTMALAV